MKPRLFLLIGLALQGWGGDASAWVNEWRLVGKDRSIYHLHADKQTKLVGSSLRLSSSLADPDQSAGAMHYHEVHQQRGQRIRVQMKLRSEGVEKITVYVFTSLYKTRWPETVRSYGKRVFQRPADEWTSGDVVLQIPDDAFYLVTIITQDGPGQTWIDDVRIAEADNNVVLDGPVHLKRPTTLDSGAFQGLRWPESWSMQDGQPGELSVINADGQTVIELLRLQPQDKPLRLVQSVWARKLRKKTVRLTGQVLTEIPTSGARLFVEFSTQQKCPEAGCEEGWAAVTEPVEVAGHWQQLDLVAKVPKKARFIRFGVSQAGEGRSLVRGVRLEPLD